MNKRKWRMSAVLFLVLFLVFYIGIVFFLFVNEILAMKLIFLLGICMCVYMMFDGFIFLKGLRKVLVFRWYIYAICFSMLSWYLENETIGTIESILFLITVVLVFVEAVNYYLTKVNEWFKEIVILFFMILGLLFFDIVAVQVNITLFWILRVITLLILICGLKIIPHVNRLLGIILIIALYIAMVAISATLSIDFLFSSISEVCVAFYRNVRNLYTLPEPNAEMSMRNLLEIMGSFLLCRIMDAILIGALVDIIKAKERPWLKRIESSTNK